MTCITFSVHQINKHIRTPSVKEFIIIVLFRISSLITILLLDLATTERELEGRGKKSWDG